MNKRLAAILGGMVLSSAAATNAAIIEQYEVHNYNGGSAPHGLWTNGNYGDNTFSFNAGSLFTIEENAGVLSATLTGTATNDSLTAVFDLTFSDFAETFNYKHENGIAYDQVLDSPDVDFFTALDGTITIGSDVYDIRLCDDCGYGFQYGTGANAKNPNELGGSAWISNQFMTGTQHWDLNLSFTPVPVTPPGNPNPVPAPASLVLFGLGLLALGATRRLVQRNAE